MRAHSRAWAETLRQAKGTFDRFDLHRLVPAREAQPTPTTNGHRGRRARPTPAGGTLKVLAANHAIDIGVSVSGSTLLLAYKDCVLF